MIDLGRSNRVENSRKTQVSRFEVYKEENKEKSNITNKTIPEESKSSLPVGRKYRKAYLRDDY